MPVDLGRMDIFVGVCKGEDHYLCTRLLGNSNLWFAVSLQSYRMACLWPTHGFTSVSRGL